LFSMLFGLAVGVAVGLVRGLTGDSAWIPAGGLALAMVFGAALFVPAWNRLDEAVRTAHQWAWFWGGSAGMVVAVILMPFVLAGDVDLSSGGGPGQTAVNAIFAFVLLQLAGYGVACSLWWLRRRS